MPYLVNANYSTDLNSEQNHITCRKPFSTLQVENNLENYLNVEYSVEQSVYQSFLGYLIFGARHQPRRTILEKVKNELSFEIHRDVTRQFNIEGISQCLMA